MRALAVVVVLLASVARADEVGIVVEDRVVLRGTPHDGGPRQALLYRGDRLEVRGGKNGYLQVWDERHERPGWVRPAVVRRVVVDAAHAGELGTVARFLGETPGMESLGIAYVALWMKAAATVDADAWEVLGGFAERLASRASGAAGDVAAAELDVATSWGVKFVSVDAGGRTEVCYDGEAHRVVLSLPAATAEARARAALALTASRCADPAASQIDRRAWDEWRRDVLAHVDASRVPAPLAAEVRLRVASVESELAFAYARAASLGTPADDARAAAASAAAVRALALVDKSELDDADLGDYDAAAVAVGASRWAGEPARAAPSHGPRIALEKGADAGQRCVRVVDDRKGVDAGAPRCTFGLVWLSSLRVAPHGDAMAVTVQPLAGWAELWVYRRVGQGWIVDALLPSSGDPDLGYVELAGWSPDGTRALLCRVSRETHTTRTWFQVLRLGTLAVEHEATRADLLVGFRRYAAPDWRGRTVALR